MVRVTDPRAARSRGLSAFAGATTVALAPLVGIVALGVAMDGQSAIGPFSAVFLLWGVILPLLALYPGIAAFVARRVRESWLVMGAATLAPALVLAVRLSMETASAGRGTLAAAQWNLFTQSAFLVVGVALATAVSIRVAATLMRRAGFGWDVAGFVAGAIFYGLTGFATVFGWAKLWPATT